VLIGVVSQIESGFHPSAGMDCYSTLEGEATLINGMNDSLFADSTVDYWNPAERGFGLLDLLEVFRTP